MTSELMSNPQHRRERANEARAANTIGSSSQSGEIRKLRSDPGIEAINGLFQAATRLKATVSS
jgi:hypothetical protein